MMPDWSSEMMKPKGWSSEMMKPNVGMDTNVNMEVDVFDTEVDNTEVAVVDTEVVMETDLVDTEADNTKVAVVGTEVDMETDLDDTHSISFTLGANHVLSDQMVRDLVLYSKIKYACTKKPFENGVKQSYVCFQRNDTSKLFELGKVCLKNVKYSRFWGLRNHMKTSHEDLEIIDDGPDRFVVKYRFKTLALFAGVDEDVASLQMTSYEWSGESEKMEEEKIKIEEKDEEGEALLDLTNFSQEELDEAGNEQEAGEAALVRQGGDTEDIPDEHADVTTMEVTEENNEQEEEEERAEPPMEKKVKKGRGGRPANVSIITQCVHCQEEFRGQKRLKKHLWNEHERATRWHCGDCDYFLASKQKLGDHMQTQRHKSNLATNGFMEVQEQGKVVKKDKKGEEERQRLEREKGKFLKCSLPSFEALLRAKLSQAQV